MSFDYRTLSLPDPWPGKRQAHPLGSPFKANWGGTMTLLERELKLLNAKDITLAIGVTLNDIRKDGGVRADARIKDPAVVLAFRSEQNTLTFPCDRFNFWQDNVRAIALALEALRKVDRYGVQQGRQYEGFRKLPSSTAPVMNTEQAAETIARLSGFPGDGPNVLDAVEGARVTLRMANSLTHPDRHHGNQADFLLVQEAKRILEAHFGAKL